MIDTMKRFYAEKTAERLISFIKDACIKESCTDVLIGVSGGIDSATSLSLAVKALGRDHIHPVLLPYGELNKKGVTDAWLVINALRIPHKQVRVIDIQPFVDRITPYDRTMDDGRKGNIMARMRMMILYDLSKKLQYLVLGTENKTEHLLGYYTRFGDEASDIEPLQSLYKTHVYALARHLHVPDEILKKQPTAGLWQWQTDEGEFGFTYTEADEILYLYYEKHMTKDEIAAKGFDKATVDRVWLWIEKGQKKQRLPYVTAD